MNTINELDTVVLLRPLSEYGLEAGDVGTVVHRYEDGDAVEIEFATGEGRTVAVVTLRREDVRLMQQHDILHIRQLAA